MNQEKKYVVSGYQPEAFFRFFEDLAAIPHGSGNEGQISAYLAEFAKQRGVECVQDPIGNILYRIPGTKGREEEPAVLLQGHMDMVCEKNRDVDHDFKKDPLSLYVDGAGCLRARGTTLGADNGVAVAAMMAAADGQIPSHPPLECLITVSEETGLDGANGFDYSQITARKLVNLDSENETLLIAGCAGGVRSDLSVTPAWEAFRGEAIRVEIKGLRGGHSGENINDGRENANKALGRALLRLYGSAAFRIAEIGGGSKENAIPREAFAVLSLPESDVENAISILEEEFRAISEELSSDDREFSYSVRKTNAPARMADAVTSRNLVAFLGTVRNGILKMSNRMKGFVEWSRNLGVIRMEGDKLDFVFSSRSAIESQLDASIAELNALAELCGLAVRHYNRYPGWNYRENSPLRDKYVKACREELGMETEVTVIHAGLECGVISSMLPGLDAISFGPNMHDIHSPNEALELDSTERFFRKIVALLA